MLGSNAALQNGDWLLESDGRRGDSLAPFGPYLAKAGQIGAKFVRFVDQQFAARLVAVEADQCVFVVDDDHAVAQMGQLKGRFLSFGKVAISSQEFLKHRMLLADWYGIAYGNSERLFVAKAKNALDGYQSIRRLKLQRGQILVINADFLAGNSQQTVHCRLVICPGGDQFASHGV